MLAAQERDVGAQALLAGFRAVVIAAVLSYVIAAASFPRPSTPDGAFTA